MMSSVFDGLLWFAALGGALLAGVYFAFSAFVMTSLGRLAPPMGIAAMQAINDVIVRSLFMALFLATTIAGAALTILAVFRWSEPDAAPAMAGGIAYVLGMFLVTALFNVPLNNALAAVNPASREAAAVWARYLRVWTRWNHVRTTACTASTALYVAAIAA